MQALNSYDSDPAIGCDTELMDMDRIPGNPTRPIGLDQDLVPPMLAEEHITLSTISRSLTSKTPIAEVSPSAPKI